MYQEKLKEVKMLERKINEIKDFNKLLQSALSATGNSDIS